MRSHLHPRLLSITEYNADKLPILVKYHILNVLSRPRLQNHELLNLLFVAVSNRGVDVRLA